MPIASNFPALWPQGIPSFEPLKRKLYINKSCREEALNLCNLLHNSLNFCSLILSAKHAGEFNFIVLTNICKSQIRN